MSTAEFLQDMFGRLLGRFGPQGWWPGETPFEVMIGAILTQNTNWGNVEKAIANLKREADFTPQGLLALPTERLAELIRPSGYFNQKAAKLREFLEFYLSTTGGETRRSNQNRQGARRGLKRDSQEALSRLKQESQQALRRMRRRSLAALRRDLLAVRGIGPETADSILLYALGKPVFVVDAYTRRVLSRHGACRPDASYDELQRLFMDHLPADTKLFNEFHALLVRVGKEHCRKSSPRCEGCPLEGMSFPASEIVPIEH